MTVPTPSVASEAPSPPATGFVQGLGLFDCVMIVAGAMIGSGIFIVPAAMAREIGSSGGLLLAWVFGGALTIAAALSYGELASMMPRTGGMYVYLREAFSPLWGFLYGWTFFTVIQTGTLAAVGVAFARFLGVLWPVVAEDRYLIPPFHVSPSYALSVSTSQLVAILVIALLTWTNSRGLRYGKWVQNLFTVAKVGALLGLIAVGLALGWNAAAVKTNFAHLWTAHLHRSGVPGLDVATTLGLFAAICVAQSGSLFSADSWHDVAFAADEVKNPRRTLPLALGLGTLTVIGLYLLANVAYLATLPLPSIQDAPYDRVGTATLQAIFPGLGKTLMAVAIMISTFGCINSLVLAGSRAYYAMARDRLFFAPAGRLNRARVPGWSLLAQGVWAAALVLPRTFDPSSGKYGNVYSNLLDYVISAALIFYVLTIAGLFRLRATRPAADRPYKVPGYPVVPAAYILGATVVVLCLFIYRPYTTWPGLLIVACGLPVYRLRPLWAGRKTDTAQPKPDGSQGASM
jgi:APA family basic amino acid/polyamine antiporter